jgi:hypothetical protein
VVGVERVLSVMESAAERVELSQDETTRCDATRLSDTDKPRSYRLRRRRHVLAGRAAAVRRIWFCRTRSRTRRIVGVDGEYVGCPPLGGLRQWGGLTELWPGVFVQRRSVHEKHIDPASPQFEGHGGLPSAVVPPVR